jgi:hypothetical protein
MHVVGMAMVLEMGLCAHVLTKRRRQESRRTLEFRTRRETFAVLSVAVLGVVLTIVASLPGN